MRLGEGVLDVVGNVVERAMGVIWGSVDGLWYMGRKM